MGTESTMRTTRRVVSDESVNLLREASILAKAYFKLLKKSDSILCESLAECSRLAFAGKEYTGDVDLLAFTAVAIAIELGIPKQKLGIILCDDLEHECGHVIAFMRHEDQGMIIFGDLNYEEPYLYAIDAYRIKYFVNIETGSMKEIVDLQNS